MLTKLWELALEQFMCVYLFVDLSSRALRSDLSGVTASGRRVAKLWGQVCLHPKGLKAPTTGSQFQTTPGHTPAFRWALRRPEAPRRWAGRPGVLLAGL